jgi:uncharacterized protein
MSFADISLEQHFRAGGPKRILSIDGGGLRGVLALAILARVERILKERHGGSGDFRLSQYFDLMAGTSTGAVIAACLALGMTVEEVGGHYFKLGRNIFQKSPFRLGFFRAKYDAAKLEAELKSVFGADTTLGSPKLKTGLMVMLKRLDSGSPWPLSNNPAGKYFKDPGDNCIPNRDYPLWKVVRASTAAPSFFDPEPFTIAEAAGCLPVIGEFVDGGVSPHNNPAFQAFMFATIGGYKLGWPAGADRIELVSVGTGTKDPRVRVGGPTVAGALKSVVALMDDCKSQVDLMLQWLSDSPTARSIDGEVGDLRGDLLGGVPQLTYLRYDVDLSMESVLHLKPGLSVERVESLSAMDDPDNMELLMELGARAADKTVVPQHFREVFDLRR